MCAKKKVLSHAKFCSHSANQFRFLRLESKIIFGGRHQAKHDIVGTTGGRCQAKHDIVGATGGRCQAKHTMSLVADVRPNTTSLVPPGMSGHPIWIVPPVSCVGQTLGRFRRHPAGIRPVHSGPMGAFSSCGPRHRRRPMSGRCRHDAVIVRCSPQARCGVPTVRRMGAGVCMHVLHVIVFPVKRKVSSSSAPSDENVKIIKEN